MKPSNLQSSILTKIREDGVTPIPWWPYRLMEFALWSTIIFLIAASSIFGAFLVQDSLDLFRFGQHARTSAYFPWLVWSGLIAVIILSGIVAFRKTPTGYRYSTVRDILVWLSVTLFLIPVLKLTGVGPAFHSRFVDSMPTAANFIYQASSWNDPEGGRIAGTVESADEGSIVLRALDGRVWRVVWVDNAARPSFSIVSGERVRVIGSKSSEDSFVAEKVLPWFGKGAGGWYGRRGVFDFSE